MTGERRRAVHWGVAMAVLAVAAALPEWSAGAVKTRTVVVMAFDPRAVPAEEQWVGEGVAQIVSLGLTQHPAFVQIGRERLRDLPADGSGPAGALQVLHHAKADAVIFGEVERSAGGLVIRPRLLESHGSNAETLALEPITVGDGELLERLAPLPGTYARTLKVPLTEAEASRIDRAAHPTRVARAFELYVRGTIAASRGGQEGKESAAELLARAIEADPNFVVAQYTLGTVHQALGNRWKAAAQYRASTQLDPTYPEPYKALGDLFLTAPRRLFDQAVEAYSKAIELRPFYAEAHVGLGDARAAKGDVDGAITAYRKALALNPANPRVHMSLGKIYYGEKGLYYEAVAAYRKAIEIDPASVEARMGLGEVYEDKGLYKEAIEEYRRVMEIDPKHTGALYNLALVYEKIDPREAVAQWERYITLASQVPSEKDWVDTAKLHLKKLKSQLKD